MTRLPPTLTAAKLRHAVPKAVLALVLGLVRPAAPAGSAESPLPAMPPLLDPHDVYAAARPGELSPAVRGVPPRV